MPEEEKNTSQLQNSGLERKGFFYILFGGAVAAFAGWIAGMFPRSRPGENAQVAASTSESRISKLETIAAQPTAEVSPNALDARISALETHAAKPIPSVSQDYAEARITALETTVGQQTDELRQISAIPPIAHLEGGNNELVVFNRKELSVINPDGVLLNLVATNGGVGIRFYKDFGFGNEKETNPWHMGWIEGLKGYEGLAILRDWRFTAALWDEDGKLLLGKLDPHPPANQPARARVQVRGSVDEVQALIEAGPNQTADILQITNGAGKTHFVVNGSGNVVIGTPDQPKEVILHDTVDGTAYALQVTNGRLVLRNV